jgi:Bacterial PH domain
MLVSALSLGILVLVAFAVGSRVPDGIAGGLPHRIVLAIPLAALVGSALFTIRGYTLAPRQLLVQRLLWSTRVPLAGLERAWHDPHAMDRSIRLFGNGGFLSISGLFRNRTLGRYRAYATDPGRAVVLALGGRTVVVTPGEPRVFLQHLQLVVPGVVVSETAAAPSTPAR